MKKQKTYILTILIVVAILGVLLFLVTKMPSKEQNSSSSNNANSVALVNVDSDDIKNINVKNSMGEYNIKVESSENTFTYSVDKLDETQKLSKDKIDGILNTLSKLNAIETVQEDCEDMSDFGLVDPMASIKITLTDDNEKTFYIGNNAPFNAGVYLKVEGSKTVYLISKQSATPFSYSVGSLIDTTPPPGDDNENEEKSADNDAVDNQEEHLEEEPETSST